MDYEHRLDALCQISQEKLAKILGRIPGKKDLIIDPLLMKPLERITGVSFLRSHGVDKLFKLDETAPRCVNPQWVYLIQSDLITAKHVSDQINADLRSGHTNSYHMILVPCQLVAVQHLLEEDGIYGSVTVHTYSWELLRLDTSLLSLELPKLFQKMYVDGDSSYLPVVARSLWSLQLLFGRIPLVVTQGRFSSKVRAMTDVLLDELGTPDKPSSEIECLVLVDRDVDYASVLLTPVTYAGLLDEVLGICGGTVEFDSRVTGGKGTVNYHLGGATDSIYDEIKNKHFSDVFSLLSMKAKTLQAEYDRSCKMALHEMKQYVATELQQVTAAKRALAYHIGACEVVIGEMGHRFEALNKAEQSMLADRNKREYFSYVEDCLVTGEKLQSLRLLSLMSLTQDGFSQEEATKLQTQFLHACGYEHLNAFHNLEKLGLFTCLGGLGAIAGETAGKLADRVAQVVSLPKRGNSFQSMARKLKLFPNIQEDYDLASTKKDMGYVFSGSYVPLVCQLVNLLIKSETSIEEILKLIPPPTSATKASDVKPRSFLVYYIGGVTYAEIAAFHLLESLTGARILVAGSAIINGNTLVKSAL